MALILSPLPLLADTDVNQIPTSNGRGDASTLVRRMSFDETDEAFTEDTASAVCEKLQKVILPQLSGHEQIQLLDIVECAGVVEKQRRSMDENGARFMLFFRQHALRKGRTNAIQLSWRETSWAYHSTSQDILTDFVSRQYHGSLLWENARESGIFMWLTDEAAVVSIPDDEEVGRTGNHADLFYRKHNSRLLPATSIHVVR